MLIFERNSAVIFFDKESNSFWSSKFFITSSWTAHDKSSWTFKIFEIALETILQKGKTKLGDKTIAESLNFIIRKLKNNNQNYDKVFRIASKEALDDFKGKKIKIGRARMFEDKTKKFDDPGMFAIYRLLQFI